MRRMTNSTRILTLIAQRGEPDALMKVLNDLERERNQTPEYYNIVTAMKQILKVRKREAQHG